MRKIWKLGNNHSLKQPYSSHIYEQLKYEGKSSKEAMQIIGIWSQINHLINDPEVERSQLCRPKAEDSLSINTSDADDIESQYYVDDAIVSKIESMNKNFKSRVKLMTKVMKDRIEESSSSDEFQNLIKSNHGGYYRKNQSSSQGEVYKHKRQRTDDYIPSVYSSQRVNTNSDGQYAHWSQSLNKSQRKHGSRIKRKRRYLDLEKEAQRINEFYQNCDNGPSLPDSAFEVKRARANEDEYPVSDD